MTEKRKELQYYVVEFPKEAVEGSCPMSVISEKWVFKDNDVLFCWWPNYKSDKTRNNAVRQHTDIGPEIASMCEIKIKYKSGSVDDACKKMKLLEITSDIESDKDEQQHRRKFHSTKFTEYIEIESSDSNGSIE